MRDSSPAARQSFAQELMVLRLSLSSFISSFCEQYAGWLVDPMMRIFEVQAPLRVHHISTTFGEACRFSSCFACTVEPGCYTFFEDSPLVAVVLGHWMRVTRVPEALF
jgi:hypothetical protein